MEAKNRIEARGFPYPRRLGKVEMNDSSYKDAHFLLYKNAQGGYSGMNVTGRSDGFFWVENFQFWDFFGLRILLGIFFGLKILQGFFWV